MNQEIKRYLQNIKLPADDSHKGQNGKLLLIGGSELFHAASKWSLDVASKFVDMVFYSSVHDNNELIKEAKGEFWNGIVVERDHLEDYLSEADAILIGPGMMRDEKTTGFVNNLIGKHQEKKWVIDAGALQVIDPSLLNENHIITPHTKEMLKLEERFEEKGLSIENLKATVLLKSKIDRVYAWENDKKITIEVDGGNSGMTKGGSGDSLAGLVAALYCTHDAVTSAVVSSYINKKAGDELYKTVGPYFNTSDLVEMIPQVFWQEINR